MKLPNSSKPARRNFVVVVGAANGEPVYLGSFDDSARERCGVRLLENAIRYTAVGASRIAAGFSAGRVEEVTL